MRGFGYSGTLIDGYLQYNGGLLRRLRNSIAEKLRYDEAILVLSGMR